VPKLASVPARLESGHLVQAEKEALPSSPIALEHSEFRNASCLTNPTKAALVVQVMRIKNVLNDPPRDAVLRAAAHANSRCPSRLAPGSAVPRSARSLRPEAPAISRRPFSPATPRQLVPRNADQRLMSESNDAGYGRLVIDPTVNATPRPSELAARRAASTKFSERSSPSTS
jgi:hypothetical protein